MLDHRRRRWPNIKQALARTGNSILAIPSIVKQQQEAEATALCLRVGAGDTAHLPDGYLAVCLRLIWSCMCGSNDCLHSFASRAITGHSPQSKKGVVFSLFFPLSSASLPIPFSPTPLFFRFSSSLSLSLSLSSFARSVILQMFTITVLYTSQARWCSVSFWNS